MKSIVKIYRRNIYGVMGTLLFHILLFASFLLAEVDMKGNVKEEALVIEFPDILPEPEKPLEEEIRENEIVQQNNNANPTTNAASNRLSAQNNTKSANEFLDDNYLKEVEAAKQLRASVNSNLAKETVDINSIKMPVETNDKLEQDSVKNKNYTGESNIVYYLENRYHLSLPIPVYLCQGGGKIVVDIVVDRQGRVVQASPRQNPAVRDEQMYLYAKAAAVRTVFNSDGDSQVAQKGRIEYTFVAQ